MTSSQLPGSEAEGFVLAGGRSSRMGRDKALEELHGRNLAARAVDLLRTAGMTATIAGARSELDDLAPVISDEAPDRGPLSGICSALSQMSAELGLFVPVDMPFLPASLLEYLIWHSCITHRAVTLASVNGFIQPFPVVLSRKVLPFLKSELAAGRRGCLSAFHSASETLGQPIRPVSVELLAQAGQISHSRTLPPYQWFLNVNSPQDLDRARSSIA